MQTQKEQQQRRPQMQAVAQFQQEQQKVQLQQQRALALKMQHEERTRNNLPLMTNIDNTSFAQINSDDSDLSDFDSDDLSDFSRDIFPEHSQSCDFATHHLDHSDDLESFLENTLSTLCEYSSPSLSVSSTVTEVSLDDDLLFGMLLPEDTPDNNQDDPELVENETKTNSEQPEVELGLEMWYLMDSGVKFVYFAEKLQHISSLSNLEVAEQRDLITLDLLCFVERLESANTMTDNERCHVFDQTVGILNFIATEWSSMAQSEDGYNLIVKLFEFGDEVQKQNLIQNLFEFLGEGQMNQLVTAIQRQHEGLRSLMATYCQSMHSHVYTALKRTNVQ